MEKQNRIYGSFKLLPENSWSWTRNDGGIIKKGIFFECNGKFKINTLIQYIFHVEDPVFEKYPKLYNLKIRMISRILNSDLERTANKNNLSYVKGRYKSLIMIRIIQSTGVFHILIKNSNNKIENMKMNVHDHWLLGLKNFYMNLLMKLLICFPIKIFSKILAGALGAVGVFAQGEGAIQPCEGLKPSQVLVLQQLSHFHIGKTCYN